MSVSPEVFKDDVDNRCIFLGIAEENSCEKGENESKDP